MRQMIAIAGLAATTALAADDFPKPYSAPCVERPPLRRDLAPVDPGAGENVFSARGGSLPEAGRQPSAESSPSEAEKEQYE